MVCCHAAEYRRYLRAGWRLQSPSPNGAALSAALPQLLPPLPPPPPQLLAVGYRWASRLRLRHIPLVRPMPFLLGHLWSFRKKPMYLLYEEWARQYGGIFLVFFGKNPVVVIAGEPAVACMWWWWWWWVVAS